MTRQLSLPLAIEFPYFCLKASARAPWITSRHPATSISLICRKLWMTRSSKGIIAEAHIVGIRSRTHLTDKIFSSFKKLMAVSCFSVGTNQVDLDAARRRGIPAIKALPYSNTRSVAELMISEIIMLTRRIFPRSASAHEEAGRTNPPLDTGK